MLNDRQIRTVKHHAYSLLHHGDLRKLAIAFGTDKEGVHYYAQHYQHHFHGLRQQAINLLEIGIGGYDDPKAGGCSLRMWKAYFPRASIYGMDICDKSYHNEDRIKTFKGSQVDEHFLQRMMGEIGSVDIIIDDGSHQNEHVIKTFHLLFPLLRPGGIYIVEDLQTSYWGEKWGGSHDLNAPHTSMNFLKGLVDGLNHEDFRIDGYTPSYFDKHIASIHFYHNMAFVYKREAG